MKTTLKTVSAAAVASILFPVIGCASQQTNAADETASNDLVSDVVSMTQRPDGNFDVICKGLGGGANRLVIASAAEITSNTACSAAPSPPPSPAPPAASGESPHFDAHACPSATPTQLFGGWGYRLVSVSVYRRSRSCQGTGAFRSCSAWSESPATEGSLSSQAYSDASMTFSLGIGNTYIKGYGSDFSTLDSKARVVSDFRPSEGFARSDAHGAVNGELSGTSGGVGGYSVPVSGAIGDTCLRIVTPIIVEPLNPNATTEYQSAWVR